MIEIYDIADTSFLSKYEQNFLDEGHQTNNQFSTAMAGMPQYLIEKKEYIKELISHFDQCFYPDWKRIVDRSYVFKFKPDKPTMSPHIDVDPDTCKQLKGLIKRVILYANPYWDTSWGGGTYFSEFENYKCSRHYTAKVNRRVFASEATLVENKPGRSVIFDLDEWHMPQEFSGSTCQRIIFSYGIVHPDFNNIIGDVEKVVTPDNKNGAPVASYNVDRDHGKRAVKKKSDVAEHIDTSVVDWIIKDIK